MSDAGFAAVCTSAGDDPAMDRFIVAGSELAGNFFGLGGFLRKLGKFFGKGMKLRKSGLVIGAFFRVASHSLNGRLNIGHG